MSCLSTRASEDYRAMETLIVLTDVVEKILLLTLLGLSIWSVSIIIDRRRTLRREKDFLFEDLKKWIDRGESAPLKSWIESHPGFVAGALNAVVLAKKEPESIDRSFQSFVKAERLSLEKGMAVLATLGANAPFIGLFGTVLGIIRAFAYLGSQTGSQAVMSGVSQALYATAVGLFVAIPAVVAYNIFSKAIRDLQIQSESLKDLYVSKL